MTIFKEGSLTRNALWVFLGQGFSVVCLGTYFVLLARLLGKVEYGIYAGAFAMVAILSPYSTLGSPLVLLRHVSPDHRKFASYWGNVLMITPILGIAFIALLAWGGPHIAPSYSWQFVACVAFADCLCAQLTIAAGQAFMAFEKLSMTAIFNLLVNFLRTLLAGLMLWRLHHATARQWAVDRAGRIFDIDRIGAVFCDLLLRQAFFFFTLFESPREGRSCLCAFRLYHWRL